MARLEIQLVGNNKDLKKVLKDTKSDLSAFGKGGIDVKPLTAYQAELIKIKKEAIALTKQKDEDRKAQSALNAEIKKQAAAEKAAAAEASKRKTIISDSTKEAKEFNKATSGTNGKVNSAFTSYLQQVKKDFDSGKISAQQYVAELERYSVASIKNAQATSQSTQSNKQNTLSKKQLAEISALEALKERESAAAIKNHAREIGNAKGSLENRRAALIRLNGVFDRLNESERKSRFGERLSTTIKGLDAQIKQLEGSTGRFQRNVGNYTKGSTGVFGSISNELVSLAAGYATFSAVYAGASKIVHTNLEISDSLTDVQRTAKLSTTEVSELSKELQKLDTRTSLEGLLDIGFIGGRLNVQKDDLVDFIKQVDELSVVLKKEFPGGAEAVAESLGKIVSIYKITQKEGVSLGTALSKVGSNLLELAHSGPVTLKYLQDFTLGLAGTAASANLSLPVIAAYGAVLGEAGQIASSAALAVTRLVNDLSTKREKYFAIAQLGDANLTLEKFTDLINTDAKKALDSFFKGLKSGNPLKTELDDRLKSVGITTGKVSNAVKILANNQDKLAEKIVKGTKGYEENISVSHNFELANGNLASSVDKLQNALSNLTTNPNSNVAKFFKGIVDSSRYAIEAISDFQEAVSDAQDIADKKTISSYNSRSGSPFQSFLMTDANKQDLVDAIKREKQRVINRTNNPIIEQGFAKADQLAAGKNEIGVRKTLTVEIVKQKIALDRLNNALKFVSNPNNSSEKIAPVSANINRLRANAARQNAVVKRLRSKIPGDTTVLGDGSLVEDSGNERTPEIIKAEIKALSKANDKLGKGTKELALGVARLKILKKELRDALGIETKAPSTPKAPSALPLLDSAELSGLDGVDSEIEKSRLKYSEYYGKLDEYNKKKNANLAKSDQLRAQAQAAEAKEVTNIIVSENQKVADTIAKITEEAGIVAEQSRLKELQQNEAKYNELARQNVGQADVLNAIEQGRLQQRLNINQKYDDKLIEDSQKLYDKINDLQEKSFTENVQGNAKGRAKIKKQLDDRLADFQNHFDELRKLYKNDPIALVGINAVQLANKQNTEAKAKVAGEAYKTQQTEAVRGAVESFGRDLTNTLRNLSTTADGTFKGIFSSLSNGLIDSLNDVNFSNFSKKLSDALTSGSKLNLSGAEATALGLGLAGTLVSGATKKSSVAGQGLGGALSGAGAGATIGSVVPGLGTVAGALIGGGIGLLSGIFGASKAKKQEQLEAQQLAEQKRQTVLLERANALAYASQIVGRQTTSGVITGVDINEFGQVITKVVGNDLWIINERVNKSRQRGK